MCEKCLARAGQVTRLKKHVEKLEAELKAKNTALQEERKNHARLSYTVRKAKMRERHATVRSN